MYNPYQKYKEQSLTTLTPAEIILKLFDEAVKQIKLAINYIEEKDIASANKAIVKTEDIVNALKFNLDDRYEISKELETLYTHIYNSLVEANLKKDTQMLGEIHSILFELRDTFTQANKLSKGNNI
ncbi:MAG: flagellar export chaperone FliS [Oscillospiraceae bacterium]